MEGNGQADQGLQHSIITRDTGIAPEYGEKTWRPVQSVIDIVQNHLDANTTVYEKKLLRTLGITEYKPADEQQQRTISALNLLKYAKTPDEIAQAQAGLKRLPNGDTPDFQAVKEELEGVEYQLPDLKLKVSNGSEFHYVSYAQVKDLDPQWQVTGFLVDDKGSGFDNQLLGIIGGSTKSDSSGKRGGLGEGLKMSITHLLRSGATVHLVSRNADELWTADPRIENGTVNFTGIAITGEKGQQQGSTTEVDFATEGFDPKLREELAGALDPRVGEGLGKYILDFRGEEFFPIVNNGSAELASLAVPQGRIYVRGLLVQESGNTLWSYNLGDKWAIGGRDRKTVKPDALQSTIRTALSSLDNPEQVREIVGLVKGRNPYQETKLLNENLFVDGERHPQWQQAIAEIFNFSPGKTLFAPANITADQELFARERGFTIIRIPPENAQAIALFKKFYPDQTIALDQLQGTDTGAHPTGERATTRDTSPVVDTEIPLDPETAAIVQGCKDTFHKLVIAQRLKQLGQGGQPLFDTRKLDTVRFVQAPAETHFESDSTQFVYDARKNLVYVRGDIDSQNFGVLTDVSVQLLKSLTGRDTFDGKSQEILTQLAGDAVASLRPDLLSELTITPTRTKIEQERPTTYPQDKREADERIIELMDMVDRVNMPNITRAQLDEALASIKDAGIPAGINLNMNRRFYFDGKLYSLTPADLELSEMRIGKGTPPQLPEEPTSDQPAVEVKPFFDDTETQALRKLGFPRSGFKKYLRGEGKPFGRGLLNPKPEPDRKILNPEETEHRIQAKEISYLPYQLEDGASMRLAYSDGEHEGAIVIKRRGNKIIATKHVDGKKEVIPSGKGSTLFQGSGWDLSNNVISFRPSTEITMKVDRTSISSDELTETNRGKDVLGANITLDYGGEVWRDPRRILLDAIQNHIDAKKDVLPDITYTVVDASGNVQQLTREILETKDESWKIIGMTISDEGAGYPTPYLTVLGKSTKGDEDLGKFGEGLKMLSASAMRQGISVTLSSRDWQASPTSYTQTVKDYETGTDKTFEMLGYDMQWSEEPRIGSQTHFSFFTLPDSGNRLTDSQQAELAHASGEKNAIWQAWVDVLDPRKADEHGRRGLARYVLPKDDRPHTDGIVTLLTDRAGSVYEKGLLITGESTKPRIFGYNVDETIIDTRERNAFNQELLDTYVKEYFNTLTDKEVMRQILETTKQHPGIDYYEYQFFLFSNEMSPRTKALWRQTYHEVFGDDAVLSLRARLEEFDRIGASMNRFSYGLIGDRDTRGSDDYRQELAKAVGAETHLENGNLQRLPPSLTSFFMDDVYTSKDFRKELESADIELSGDDKEKLARFVQTTNQLMLTILESLDSHPQGRAYLETIIPRDQLEMRKAELQSVTSDDIHVKHATFPALGMVERINNRPVVSLNQSILRAAGETIGTYVHESSHYLSDQNDYVLGFQRFLMALVMSRLTTSKN